MPSPLISLTSTFLNGAFRELPAGSFFSKAASATGDDFSLAGGFVLLTASAVALWGEGKDDGSTGLDATLLPTRFSSFRWRSSSSSTLASRSLSLACSV